MNKINPPDDRIAQFHPTDAELGEITSRSSITLETAEVAHQFFSSKKPFPNYAKIALDIRSKVVEGLQWSYITKCLSAIKNFFRQKGGVSSAYLLLRTLNQDEVIHLLGDLAKQLKEQPARASQIKEIIHAVKEDTLTRLASKDSNKSLSIEYEERKFTPQGLNEIKRLACALDLPVEPTPKTNLEQAHLGFCSSGKMDPYALSSEGLSHVSLDMTSLISQVAVDLVMSRLKDRAYVSFSSALAKEVIADLIELNDLVKNQDVWIDHSLFKDSSFVSLLDKTQALYPDQLKKNDASSLSGSWPQELTYRGFTPGSLSQIKSSQLALQMGQETIKITGFTNAFDLLGLCLKETDETAISSVLTAYQAFIKSNLDPEHSYLQIAVSNLAAQVTLHCAILTLTTKWKDLPEITPQKAMQDLVAINKLAWQARDFKMLLSFKEDPVIREIAQKTADFYDIGNKSGFFKDLDWGSAFAHTLKEDLPGSAKKVATARDHVITSFGIDFDHENLFLDKIGVAEPFKFYPPFRALKALKPVLHSLSQEVREAEIAQLKEQNLWVDLPFSSMSRISSLSNAILWARNKKISQQEVAQIKTTVMRHKEYLAQDCHVNFDSSSPDQLFVKPAMQASKAHTALLLEGRQQVLQLEKRIAELEKSFILEDLQKLVQTKSDDPNDLISLNSLLSRALMHKIQINKTLGAEATTYLEKHKSSLQQKNAAADLVFGVIQAKLDALLQPDARLDLEAIAAIVKTIDPIRSHEKHLIVALALIEKDLCTLNGGSEAKDSLQGFLDQLQLPVLTELVEKNQSLYSYRNTNALPEALKGLQQRYSPLLHNQGQNPSLHRILSLVLGQGEPEYSSLEVLKSHQARLESLSSAITKENRALSILEEKEIQLIQDDLINNNYYAIQDKIKPKIKKLIFDLTITKQESIKITEYPQAIRKLELLLVPDEPDETAIARVLQAYNDYKKTTPYPKQDSRADGILAQIELKRSIHALKIKWEEQPGISPEEAMKGLIQVNEQAWKSRATDFDCSTFKRDPKVEKIAQNISRSLGIGTQSLFREDFDHVFEPMPQPSPGSLPRELPPLRNNLSLDEIRSLRKEITEAKKWGSTFLNINFDSERPLFLHGIEVMYTFRSYAPFEALETLKKQLNTLEYQAAELEIAELKKRNLWVDMTNNTIRDIIIWTDEPFISSSSPSKEELSLEKTRNEERKAFLTSRYHLDLESPTNLFLNPEMRTYRRNSEVLVNAKNHVLQVEKKIISLEDNYIISRLEKLIYKTNAKTPLNILPPFDANDFVSLNTLLNQIILRHIEPDKIMTQVLTFRLHQHPNRSAMAFQIINIKFLAWIESPLSMLGDMVALIEAAPNYENSRVPPHERPLVVALLSRDLYALNWSPQNRTLVENFLSRLKLQMLTDLNQSLQTTNDAHRQDDYKKSYTPLLQLSEEDPLLYQMTDLLLRQYHPIDPKKGVLASHKELLEKLSLTLAQEKRPLSLLEKIELKLIAGDLVLAAQTNPNNKKIGEIAKSLRTINSVSHRFM